MFSSKIIVAAACVGFFLSFFTGLFSGIGFGLVLLRAVIFAALLAALFLGIKFVFERFLDMGEFENSPVPSEVNVGTMVDVTVGDDELTEEDSAPGFYVDAKVSPKSTEPEEVKVSVEPKSEDSTSSSVSSIEPQKQEGDELPNVQSGSFVRSDIQTMTSSSMSSDIDETSDLDDNYIEVRFNNAKQGLECQPDNFIEYPSAIYLYVEDVQYYTAKNNNPSDLLLCGAKMWASSTTKNTGYDNAFSSPFLI